MSHEVFRLHELKQKLPYKIESIAAVYNLFFLGTSEGKIVVYEVFHDTHEAQCVHIHTSKHKHPVRAIIPIMERELLLVLVGDVILVHHLHALGQSQLDSLPEDRLPELSPVKGARDIIALHVKRQRDVFSMAVLQRKKITVYEYNAQLREFVVVNDSLQIPEGARTVIWVGKNLMIGFRREYVFLDVATGAMDCLYPTGRSGVPLLLSLDPVPEVLVGEDSTGIRVLQDGSPVPGKSGMPWPSLPSSATYVHPFLLTAHSSNCIEVRVPFLCTASTPQAESPAAASALSSTTAASSALAAWSRNPSLCQIINIKYADRISQRPFADFDARLPTRESPADVFRKDIIIALNSSNTVYLLELVPVQEQVLALASFKAFEAGLALSQLCLNEVGQTTIENLKTLYALWCFTTRQFKAAMVRFRDSNTDPRLVINLFPGFLARRARESWRPLKEFAKSIDGTDLAEHMQEAVDAFVDYAIPLRCEYTTGDAISEAIDTALMKAYVLMGEEQRLLQFLAEPNACLLDEAEEFLSDSEQWVALALLWYRRGCHAKSLDMLYALGTTGLYTHFHSSPSIRVQGRDTNSNNSSHHHHHFHNDNSGNSSGSSAATQLPFSENFLRVLGIVLIETETLNPPETSYSVTLGNNANNSSSISCSGVNSSGNVCFTPQCKLKSALALAHQNATDLSPHLRFLPRCIGVVSTLHYLSLLPWAEPDSAALVDRYAPWILANVSPRWSVGLIPWAAHADVSISSFTLRLLNSDLRRLGKTSSHERVAEWLSRAFSGDCNASCPNTTLHDAYWRALTWIIFESGDAAKATEARERLSGFLCASQRMDLEAARMVMEQPNVRTRAYAERAILYQRLRLHNDAMRMFVMESKQLSEAQAYAVRVSRDDGEDAFGILLRLLLHPQGHNEEPRLDEAIAIVNSSDGVDALTALPMIPDSAPIAAVAPFLQRALRDVSTRSQHAAVFASILEARVRHVEADVARERARCVVVDLGTVCAVCGKKLRPDTVFARFPNGAVVHQACMNDEHVCPVTHEDFRRGAEAYARADM